MRKYIVGIFIGFCLSFAVSAHAEIADTVKSLIGKKVEGTFPVIIEGKKLEMDAVVIEGSTYLPVRVFGESTGYKVGLDADMGVSMEKSSSMVKPKADATRTKDGDDSVINKIVDQDPMNIEKMDELIKLKKADVLAIQMTIETNSVVAKANGTNYEETSSYKTFKERLIKYEAELSDLEKQKVDLHN